jgi:hypothetical protein
MSTLTIRSPQHKLSGRSNHKGRHGTRKGVSKMHTKF